MLMFFINVVNEHVSKLVRVVHISDVHQQTIQEGSRLQNKHCYQHSRPLIVRQAVEISLPLVAVVTPWLDGENSHK